MNSIENHENNVELVTFTKLEINKFMPLLFYDEIKERNKLKSEEKVISNIPFFLDFEKKD